MRQLFLGLDPGVTGAYAILDQDARLVGCAALPIVDRHLDPHQLALQFSALRRDAEIRLVVIERQHAMPRAFGGSVASFSKGLSYGIALGVCAVLGFPVQVVLPTAWKKSYGLWHADKDRSRAVAQQLYPEAAAALRRKADHGVAEAILLARWGWLAQRQAAAAD